MEDAAYPRAAAGRTIKVQEVILRAIHGRLKRYQAAEILGISVRQMQRWKRRCVLHFHEKLQAFHDVHLFYTWVKTVLQTAGWIC